MFVVIELLKRIIEYFEIRRVKIAFVTGAAKVLSLRGIMIVIYELIMG